MQNLILLSYLLLKPTYNIKMQRVGPALLVSIVEIVPAADLERSTGKELPLWLPVQLYDVLSATASFGQAVFSLIQ